MTQRQAKLLDGFITSLIAALKDSVEIFIEERPQLWPKEIVLQVQEIKPRPNLQKAKEDNKKLKLTLCQKIEELYV